MPITRTENGAIPNHYNPNNAQRGSCQNVIAQLQYADLWRGAGTLRDNGVIRVDMQGHIPGPPIQYNMQVQVNGIQGKSTVAHAIISSTIQTADSANQRGALRSVIAALNQSLDTGNSYTVTGTSP